MARAFVLVLACNGVCATANTNRPACEAIKGDERKFVYTYRLGTVLTKAGKNSYLHLYLPTRLPACLRRYLHVPSFGGYLHTYLFFIFTLRIIFFFLFPLFSFTNFFERRWQPRPKNVSIRTSRRYLLGTYRRVFFIFPPFSRRTYSNAAPNGMCGRSANILLAAPRRLPANDPCTVRERTVRAAVLCT